MKSLQEFLESFSFSVEKERTLKLLSPAYSYSHLIPLQCDLDVTGAAAAILQPLGNKRKGKANMLRVNRCKDAERLHSQWHDELNYP